MDTEKTNWKPVPLAMDSELKREVETVAKMLGQKQAAVMRDAIRKGLPLLRPGGAAGDSLTLDSEISRYADELGKHYNRPRGWVLLEAIRRGIRAVNAYLMRTATPEVPEHVLESMFQMDPDAKPHLQEVRKARLERGTLQIRLDDLLQHCPEARERAELIEKIVTLGREKLGSYPSMWGSGVSTPELKKHLDYIEAAEPMPESERLRARYLNTTSVHHEVSRVIDLPVSQAPTGEPVKPATKPAAKKRKPKSK